jgi:hypothetical protein
MRSESRAAMSEEFVWGHGVKLLQNCCLELKCDGGSHYDVYLIHFFLEIYHIFLDILRTFTGIFLCVLRSEVSFADGGSFLS